MLWVYMFAPYQAGHLLVAQDHVQAVWFVDVAHLESGGEYPLGRIELLRDQIEVWLAVALRGWSLVRVAHPENLQPP